LITLSAWTLNYYLLLVGRFLLGLGVSGVEVASFVCLSAWWGKYFSTAETVLVSIGRLVMAIQSASIPVIYKATDSLVVALAVPLVVGIIGFVAAFTYNCFSYKYESKTLKMNKEL